MRGSWIQLAMYYVGREEEARGDGPQSQGDVEDCKQDVPLGGSRGEFIDFGISGPELFRAPSRYYL